MACWLKLESCCCCFTLRTGSLIILWLNLIICVISLLNVLPILLVEWEQTADSGINPLMTVYFILIMMFGFIPCVAGLRGIYKMKPSYLRLYVYVTLVSIVSLLAVILVLLLTWILGKGFVDHLVIELMKKNKSLPDVLRNNIKEPTASVGTLVWSAIISIGIFDFFHWYYTSVVYNYYLKLKEEMTRRIELETAPS